MKSMAPKTGAYTEQPLKCEFLGGMKKSQGIDSMDAGKVKERGKKKRQPSLTPVEKKKHQSQKNYVWKNKDKIQKRGRKEEQTEGKHLCFMGVSACSSVKFGSYRGGAAGVSEEDFVGWGIGRPMKTDRAVLSAELREAAALPP